MPDVLMGLLSGTAILFNGGLLALIAATIWYAWKRRRHDNAEAVGEIEEAALAGEPDEVGTLPYASPRTPPPPDFWLDDGHAPPPTVRELGPKERTRRLLCTNDVFHADLLAAVLRDAGIWCHVQGNADAVGATGVPATGLYVAENDFERADEIVADAEQRARANRIARGESHCPACGYDLRGTPQRCPECGLQLSDPVD